MSDAHVRPQPRSMFRTNAIRAHAAGGLPEVQTICDPPYVGAAWLLLVLLVGAGAVCVALMLLGR